MNNPILKALASKKCTLILLVIYAILMSVATIIEKFHGTPVAKDLFYYSPLFLLLQFVMVINFILMTVHLQLINRKKWAYLVLHFSLVVILTGALVTHLTGEEGMMHLREGQKSNYILVKNGDEEAIKELPFEIELTDFRLTRYPGSQSPSSYESYLKLYVDGTTSEQKVYMNNVLDLKGYRFYQASYDPDEKGSILSVNYDAIGRNITYTGYTLLFFGWILLLVSKHSRFRRLWQQLKYAVLPVLFMTSFSSEVKAQDLTISTEHAEKFGMLPMLSNNGRIVPINTFASEIVRKLKAKEVIGNLTPEQFLLSMLTYPADWSLIPLVEISEKEVAETYGWNNERISYQDAFDANHYYKLHKEMEVIYMKNPSERTRRDKELLKIDDRINILHELLTARMLRIFPNAHDSITFRWMAAGEVFDRDTRLDSAQAMTITHLYDNYIQDVKAAVKSNNWDKADEALQAMSKYQTDNYIGQLIQPSKLKTEVYYNQLNLPRLSQIGYLLTGLILLILTFRTKQQYGKGVRTLRMTTICATILFFLLHTISLGMRWYISGYAPWSNSYETMVALAWAGVLCGFIFARRNLLVTALSTLFGGSVLFVSSLNWMDPQITPLVPVLKSPWLMAHVASLVMAYGFLGISCMIGTAYLIIGSIQKSSQKLLTQLAIINELSMTLGTGLLSIGIFLGAVWANESWGRYWSWDPKETWALITLVVYAIVLHYHWFRKSNHTGSFQFLSQWAFLSILMTFLGVNYFLSGMHSYGSHDALSAIPWWAYMIFTILFVFPGALFWSANHFKKQ